MNREAVKAATAILFLPIVCSVVAVSFYAVLLPKLARTQTLIDGLHDTIEMVKNRLQVVTTAPAFAGERICEFYQYRQQMSDQYNQLTVNYDAYQPGKGIHGDIQAHVEIYNRVINNTPLWDVYIVEVSRNGWDEITVYREGVKQAVMPQVSENVLSLGYITLQIEQQPKINLTELAG